MNTERVQKIIELAAAQVGVSPLEVTAEHHFVNDLGYDSLDRAEFAMTIEDTFNVTVPDDAADRFKMVRDVVEYVERQSGSALGV